MLTGNPIEVRAIIYRCLQVSLWAAWNVAEGTTECNINGRAFLDVLVDKVADKIMPMIEIQESTLPLHGTLPLAALSTAAADFTQELYGSPMLSRKYNNIKASFKSKLDSAMCMVPRSKKDMYRKYPEHDPNYGKKRRKPRGKA
jgi:hypothetical protein